MHEILKYVKLYFNIEYKRAFVYISCIMKKNQHAVALGKLKKDKKENKSELKISTCRANLIIARARRLVKKLKEQNKV